jgi:uncharacterized protein
MPVFSFRLNFLPVFYADGLFEVHRFYMKNPEVENIKQKIIPILKQHDVSKASIFGSFVRGEQRNDSDLDLLVEFKGDKSLLDLIDLKLNIEDTLGRSADVLTLESLSPAIREIVLKEQVIVF